MALFRVLTRMAVRTSADAYTWSYVWYVEAADVDAAAVVGRDEIWPSLAVCHKTIAFCYEIYASDLVPSTTNYTVIGVDAGDQPGLVTGSGQLYRATSVCRVELNVAGGRPSRKYLRLPFDETEVTNGIVIETSAIDDINGTFTDIVAITSLRDESGNLFTGYTIKGVTDRRLGKLARNAVPPSP